MWLLILLITLTGFYFFVSLILSDEAEEQVRLSLPGKSSTTLTLITCLVCLFWPLVVLLGLIANKDDDDYWWLT